MFFVLFFHCLLTSFILLVSFLSFSCLHLMQVLMFWLSFSIKKSRFERMTCFNKDTLFRFVFQIQQTALSVVIVPRLFEEKRRDIVFGFPSFRPSVRPSVLPSFRPPNIVGTLCAQLLLQFYADSFETLQMFLSWS